MYVVDVFAIIIVVNIYSALLVISSDLIENILLLSTGLQGWFPGNSKIYTDGDVQC